MLKDAFWTSKPPGLAANSAVLPIDQDVASEGVALQLAPASAAEPASAPAAAAATPPASPPAQHAAPQPAPAGPSATPAAELDPLQSLELVDAQAAAARAQAEAHSLQLSVAGLEARVAELQHRLEEAQSGDAAALQDELSQMRMTSAMLQAEASFAVSQRQALEESSAALQQEAEQLREEPARLVAVAELLQQERDEARQQLAAVQQTAEGLRARLAAAEAERDSSPTAQGATAVEAEGATAQAWARQVDGAAGVEAGDGGGASHPEPEQQGPQLLRLQRELAEQAAARSMLEAAHAQLKQEVERLRASASAAQQSSAAAPSSPGRAPQSSLVSAADGRQVATLRSQLAALVKASQEFAVQRDREAAHSQAALALLQQRLVACESGAQASRDQCQAAAVTIDKLVAENASFTDQLNRSGPQRRQQHQLHRAGPGGNGRVAAPDPQMELPGGLQVTQSQLQLLALAEELERVNGQLVAERAKQDALRRRALKLIAANERSRAEAAAELADEQLPPASLLPAHPAALPTAAAPDQQAASVAAAPLAPPPALLVDDAAAAAQDVQMQSPVAQPLVWGLDKPTAPLPLAKPSRRGFWGSISAYITGADKLSKF